MKFYALHIHVPWSGLLIPDLSFFSYDIHIPKRNYARIQKKINYSGKSDLALQALVSGIVMRGFSGKGEGSGSPDPLGKLKFRIFA